VTEFEDPQKMAKTGFPRPLSPTSGGLVILIGVISTVVLVSLSLYVLTAFIRDCWRHCRVIQEVNPELGAA